MINIMNANTIYANQYNIFKSVSFNNFDVKSAFSLFLNDSHCDFNNFNDNIYDSSLGSCFIFNNINTINMNMLIITNSLSDYTTTGVRIKYTDNYLFTGQFNVLNNLNS